MSFLEVTAPWLVVIGLFVVLRRLERWLHQHIFKVGWLVTKDYNTTTILYYTFLLPGVVLHEVMFWLAAGLFNVKSEQAIQWPEAQEIGELDLSFIKLHKKAHPLKVALINLFPLIIGLFCVWFIANNIFQLPDIFPIMAPGTLPSVSQGIQQLLQTPDFWLWFYIAFTIANTMLPDLKALGGVRVVGSGLTVVFVILLLVGVGDEIFLEFFGGPVATVLNVLSSIFGVIIGINLIVVGVLSAIENTIEIITGDSADFKNGKMVTMTREERLSQRMKEIERQRQKRERARKTAPPVPSGPPSIYKSPLPIPGSPGDVPITPLQKMIEENEEKPQLKSQPDRAGAPMISGKLADDDDRQTQAGSDKPQLPEPS